MKIRLLPYNRRSASARALAKGLGVLVASEQQKRKHGDFDLIINWGSSAPREFTGEYINRPEAVAVSSDKRATFRAFQEAEVPCPEWTTDRLVAQQWWDDGDTVVCRTLTRANSGRGIVLASRETGTGLQAAPLYTKYAKKAHEYRVHVFGGQVLSVQQKKKRQAVANEEVDYQIRNARNGWVFCRDGVVAPDVVTTAAVRAVDSLGLDFGGADVGYNERKGTAAVYEVNTAPGLEGSTIDCYVAALLRVFPELRGGAYRRRRA